MNLAGAPCAAAPVEGVVVRPKFAFVVVLALIAAAGCAKRPETVKRYALTGKVVSTDVKASRLVVDHKAIPGFMEAMIMPYRAKDAASLQSLAPGDEISADVVVAGSDYWLENIRVTKKNTSAKPQALEFRNPQAGDEVPNFTLTNQSGQRITLNRYRGKVLLLTFIYTRCPFPDFCPRISGLFAEVNRAMLQSPATADRTHLLSVSFDPAHDTPAVLRKYGAGYVGNSPAKGFAHWEFAVPPTKYELQRMAKFFGLSYEADSGLITHSLSTTVIGPDGRIVRWYHGGDWKPDDIMRDVEQALRPVG